ncbi:MAG: tetratricopeptide repeat protein [Acidiferrobacterales bacterium]
MNRTVLILVSAALIALSPMAPAANAARNAQDWFKTGLALQKEHQTQQALSAYQQALALDPKFARAHYEIGWTYWVMNDWAKVVDHWETAKRLGFNDANLEIYLPAARDNLEGKLPALTRTRIGDRSTTLANGEPLSLELIARFQHYNPKPENPADHYDPYVFSPKSVRFFPDGSKVYVNALEGLSTIVYDPGRLVRLHRISHRFRKSDIALFAGDAADQWYAMPPEFVQHQNQFDGKPVESALSHHGRFLWVPYYRRNFDPYGTLPSAVAVIDTRNDRIVRVMETGPIPKYVTASADGKWLAVTHWGDNTVGLIDIHSDNPKEFRRANLITIGKRLDLAAIQTKDRDHGCGFCLRGSVFTADSQYLLVARMGGGGIAIIDVPRRKYLGTVYGMRPTPRHLVLSADGEMLYLSSSFAGYVSEYRTKDLINALRNPGHKLKPLRERHTGAATRTIALSSDGKLIFAAVNLESKIVVLSAPDLKPLAEIPTDSYPVGLAVSPDMTQLWVTAQGRKRRGGNSVSVFRIVRKQQN